MPSLFNNQIKYHVEDQICQISLKLPVLLSCLSIITIIIEFPFALFVFVRFFTTSLQVSIRKLAKYRRDTIAPVLS